MRFTCKKCGKRQDGQANEHVTLPKNMWASHIMGNKKNVLHIKDGHSCRLCSTCLSKLEEALEQAYYQFWEGE